MVENGSVILSLMSRVDRGEVDTKLLKHSELLLSFPRPQCPRPLQPLQRSLKPALVNNAKENSRNSQSARWTVSRTQTMQLTTRSLKHCSVSLQSLQVLHIYLSEDCRKADMQSIASFL